MIWTIIVLIVGIALFLFVKQDSKEPSLVTNVIKLVAIILIAACTSRVVMKTYLTRTNPAILQEMVTAMQEQQNAEKNKAVRAYVRSNIGEMIADAPILGKEDAKKTIFLWSDYSCPYCRRAHAELSRVLAERDDVRVVLKNFSIHGDLSDAPAKAVIAAKIQGNDKAAALDKKLMEKEYYTQDDMNDRSKLGAKVQKNVMALAAEVGLDTAQLERDMKGPVVARELKNVRDLAQKFDINGTPFLIVGEKAFPGYVPYDQIIEALGK